MTATSNLDFSRRPEDSFRLRVVNLEDFIKNELRSAISKGLPGSQVHSRVVKMRRNIKIGESALDQTQNNNQTTLH